MGIDGINEASLLSTKSVINTRSKKATETKRLSLLSVKNQKDELEHERANWFSKSYLTDNSQVKIMVHNLFKEIESHDPTKTKFIHFVIEDT